MPIVRRIEELDPILAKQDTTNARISSILAQLDITLSALRDALRGTGNKTISDLDSRLATLDTDILARLDITLSALRDALRGTGGKDFTALDTRLDTLNTNIMGKLDIALSALRDALRGTGLKDFTALDTRLANLETYTKGQRTSWVHGYITVSTAGTPVQGPNVAVAPGCEVVIIAHPNNTGLLGVGNSSSSAKISTGTPVLLAAGTGIALRVDNLNRIWVDAQVSGEKAIYCVET